MFEDDTAALLRIRIILIRIQDLKKFITDPDPGKKRFSTWKLKKIDLKNRSFTVHCVGLYY